MGYLHSSNIHIFHTFRSCGCDGKRIAFLFTDNHIVSEAFVEDINSLLNSGEITGLFPQEDR